MNEIFVSHLNYLKENGMKNKSSIQSRNVTGLKRNSVDGKKT